MPAVQLPSLRARFGAFALAIALTPASLFAAFGLSSTSGHFVVDTGAGLIFKIDESNG